MFLRSLFIIGLAGLTLGLPFPQRQFAGLTLGSVFVFSMIPMGIKQHFLKMGAYHHEISHGLVSLLTGGNFHKFFVGPAGGGHILVSGGRKKMIASAGYIGAILFGAIYLAKSAQSDSTITVLYIVAFLYGLSIIKAGDLHTASVGLAIGAFVGLATHLAPNALFTRFALNIIGVILIIDGFRSLWHLHILAKTADNTGSDAEAMSKLIGGHPQHWALIFMASALTILLVLLIIIAQL